jgi:hypothetical protein
VAQRQRQGFLVSVTWVRVSACTPVTPAVSYQPTGLAGCLVGSGISCGVRKLARTPRVKKKKKRQNSPHAINYHTSQLLMMNCMLCANFVMNHFLLEFLTCARMHKECFIKLNYFLKLYKYKKGFL